MTLQLEVLSRAAEQPIALKMDGPLILSNGPCGQGLRPNGTIAQAASILTAEV